MQDFLMLTRLSPSEAYVAHATPSRVWQTCLKLAASCEHAKLP